MADTTIEVNDVSKLYRLGEISGADLRETVIANLRRTRRQPDREVWALRDVSLSVERGTTLGLIGANGAGKSTLLKVISRVAEPTTGSSKTLGPVAALLEVGVGFHPELTGRENIFLSGSIFGMTKTQMAARLDTIVEFAGIERFVDTPVKRYSSGMFLRLGFAVASHLDNQVMVIDEVLTVGDARFRSRALDKVRNIVADDGRTVVFVSHNLDSVRSVCDQCVWLDAGQVVASGETNQVVNAYIKSGVPQASAHLESIHAAPISFRSLRMLDSTLSETTTLVVGDPFTVEMEVDVLESVPDQDIVFFVLTRGGTVVMSTYSSQSSVGDLGESRWKVRAEFPGILNAGTYVIGTNLRAAGRSLLEGGYQMNVIQFEVSGHNPGHPQQLLQVQPKWEAIATDATPFEEGMQ